ncbi:MAG TPA: hypothetical protein VMB02_12660 [Candidatus Aquilonibacter sp.]|nr:hypothetical protein [Candidatus Aquilonibacter sp.]
MTQTPGLVETAERQPWTTVEELCDRYLGGRPAPATLQLLKTVEQQRPEVRDVLERAFRLMALSRFDARDIAPAVSRFFALLAPGVLPGAWGGIVPPITLPGRHKRIDAYLRANPWMECEPGALMLDIGCGFPPQTSIDAAEAFPEWQIVGVDPAFEGYLLYDERGNYACIGAKGNVRYFQAGSPEEYLRVYADRDATIRHFAELFTQLLPALPADAGGLSTVERGGARLTRNPVSQYERPNLKFIQAGFGSSGLPQAGVVRAFNVLIYFDANFRRDAESWVAQLLRPGGVFLCGRDNAASLNAYYFVYRNENGRLAEKEFAFSADMVSHAAWFTLQEGERESWRLAELIGILRSDREFLRDYNARMDALLAENRIAVRDANGYLVEPPTPVDVASALAAYEVVAQAIETDFAGRAVEVLQRAGLTAWRNPVGHIAVGSALP